MPYSLIREPWVLRSVVTVLALYTGLFIIWRLGNG